MEVFDLEIARYALLEVLNKELKKFLELRKKYKEKQENSLHVRDLNNINDNRIRNIEIIKNSNLIENLFDILLVRDIDSIIQAYFCYDGFIRPFGDENILLSCFFPETGVLGKKGLMIGDNLKEFSNSEELREYLYDLAGFFYQPNDGTVPDDEIVDPMILKDYRTPPAISSILDNLFFIEKYKTPKRIKDIKVR